MAAEIELKNLMNVMKTGKKKARFAPAYVLGNAGRIMAFVISTSLVIHIGVLAISYLIIEFPIHLDLHKDFMGGAFTAPMLPILVAYGLLIAVACLLWFKMKKNYIHINDMEIERERQQSALQAMQATAQFFAENITENNNEIQQWIFEKKEKGQQVPRAVESASNRISFALQSLVEASYVTPYQVAGTISALEKPGDEAPERITLEGTHA